MRSSSTAKTGWLADDDDGFVKLAVQALKDEGLLAAVRRHAREGLERFSWDAIVPQLTTVYERAARTRRASGSMQAEMLIER